MLIHRNKFRYLMALALGLSAVVSGCSGLNISPSHYGKYVFKGKVTTADGKPVQNAWVKVRGWETLTDSEGRWQQEHVLHCGAMREHSGSFDEADALLISAPGFEPIEEKFAVKHPGWFGSCKPEEVLAFETVLKPESKEKAEARDASKFKPKEHPEIPWPKETPKSKGITL